MPNYQREFLEVHAPLIGYIKANYPKLMFQSDLNGVNLHGKAAREKQLIQMEDMKWLDLFVARPAIIDDKLYYGLFLELKATVRGYRLKNGNLPKNEHVRAQWASILEFRRLGYWADFAGGLDEAKWKLDGYLIYRELREGHFK